MENGKWKMENADLATFPVGWVELRGAKRNPPRRLVGSTSLREIPPTLQVAAKHPHTVASVVFFIFHFPFSIFHFPFPRHSRTVFDRCVGGGCCVACGPGQ